MCSNIAVAGGAPRVRALDGLRGLVVAVVAFHFGHFAGGWLGVDAFFTLSGFLITSLLLAEIDEAGRLGLRRFWRRRVRRLQPAALVCIAVVVATAGVWAAGGTGHAVRSEALGSVFNVANWQQLWSHRPYAAGGAPSAFEHFWSLAIEEQFYVVWPVVLAALVVIARRHVRAAAMGVALAGVAISWTLLAGAGVQRGYLGTDTRMGSILAGAVLACALPIGSRSLRHARVLGWAGLVGMGTLWVFGGWPPNMPLGVILPVHALCVVAAIIGAMHAPPRVLQWRPLAGLGLVSFGVYLWHWPVIVIVTPLRLGANELTTDLVRLALIAALTAASFVLIERPIRIERVLRATRVAFPAGVTVAVVVAVLGAGATAPAPVWATATGALVVAPPPVVRAQPVAPRAAVTRARAQHLVRHPARVLIVGDSIPTSLLRGTDAMHSLQMGDGRLLETFSAAGVAYASATLTGCPVVEEAIVADGVPRAYCAIILHRMLPSAMALFRPDLVVWYSSADAYEIQLSDGSRHEPMSSPAERTALLTRIARHVDWFAARGARVVFVSPGPDRSGYDQVDIRRDSERSMLFLDDSLHAVARMRPRTVVGIVEMSDLTCAGWRTTHQCPDVMPGGGHFRPDDGEHFEHKGAVLASVWLVAHVVTLDLNR